MDRLDPLTTEPNKYRLDDGTIANASHDMVVASHVDQLADIMRSVLSALAGIRARLDAGINTKSVATLGTVTV